MIDGLDELRADLARERGLPDSAVSFLQGGTVAELEAQADTLGGLLGTTHAQREPEPAPAPNLRDVALAEKARRRQELVALVSGRAPQPRDAAGRFATTGFDGGDGASLPVPRDPEADHNATVSQLANLRRLLDV